MKKAFTKKLNIKMLKFGVIWTIVYFTLLILAFYIIGEFVMYYFAGLFPYALTGIPIAYMLKKESFKTVSLYSFAVPFVFLGGLALLLGILLVFEPNPDMPFHPILIFGFLVTFVTSISLPSMIIGMISYGIIKIFKS